MQDFRKNTLLDEFYKRYLISYSATMDTIETTGTKLFDFYQKHLCGCFKMDTQRPGLIDVNIRELAQFIEIRKKI